MFGTSWGNANNAANPQQQTQPNAYGGFGSFGQQPQQNQQPAANPMFGNLGGGTGQPNAFGGAGTGNNMNAFGQPKPAGFGGFGGGGTFGATPAANTSTFGGAAGGATGVFGPTNTTGTTAFGSPGAFGQPKPATSTFGGGGFGAANNAPAQPTNGTLNPPYTVTTERDGTGAQSTTSNFQSITCMPAYKNSSFEELRVQDYLQNRKTSAAAGAAPSAFGATPSAFGANPAQPSTGVFGAQQPAATGTFGSSTAGTGTGLFGQQQQQPQQPQQAGGLFGNPGANNNPAAFGGGGFGTTNNQQPQPGTSLFGANNSATNNTFGAKPAFGSTPGTNAFGGGGLFGNNTNQQQAQPTNAFGAQTQNPGTTAFGGGGLFGNNNNSQQPKPLFGSTPQQPQGGGLFGGSTNPGGGLFGNNNQNQQPQPPQNTGFGGGGLFGNNQTQQTQPQQAGNLFGGGQAPTNPTGGGLFGNNPQNNTAQPNTGFGGGGLFGSKPANQPIQSGGLFGSTNNNQTGGGLFGNPNAGAANTNPGGGLFGNANQNNSATGNTGGGLFASGGGLFGNKPANQAPAQPQGNLFGGGNSLLNNNNNTAPNTAFGQSNPNLFASTSAPGVQGTLTASIAQPMAPNLPLLQNLALSPSARLLDDEPKKKGIYFMDVPRRSVIPRNGMGYAPPSTSRLRGFTHSASASTLSHSMTSAGSVSGPRTPFAALPGEKIDRGPPLPLGPSILSGLGLDESRSSQGPDYLRAASASPSLGSSARQSVKKLVFDRKVEVNDIFSRSGSRGVDLNSSRSNAMFSPQLSLAARTRSTPGPATSTPNGLDASPTAARGPVPPRAKTAGPEIGIKSPSPPVADEQETEKPLEDGDYYTRPPLRQLREIGHEALSRVENLVVGRKGYGEIEFKEPVNLTYFSKISDIMGKAVRFDEKECIVYPENARGYSDKPPVGEGLNVPARIELLGCWAPDKATRASIKDENHPTHLKHLTRLRKMKGTKFISFDIQDGRWVFEVESF